MELLLLLHNLEVLELTGDSAGHISLPAQLSWPALRELRIKDFEMLEATDLACPSLEKLCLNGFMCLALPTGLAASPRLSVLDLSGPTDTIIPKADLLAILEGVQASLEDLTIQGWELEALPAWFPMLPRLHTLCIADSQLSVVPNLPASLRSLDLQGNALTEVPAALEAMTQLTYLALGSRAGERTFQISRSLDGLINLPNLEVLSLAPELEQPLGKREIWTPQSLQYLGLAQHKLFNSGSKLQLNF
ncbi:L domain-like protein [Coccomyxa subellipsoidea C-169]|uniref:L domain-like protein n=1 Tax=Coccomyxa subellipsoidea (strain C-169) TaxID=574566 RepID=I0YUF2_COCSC|nr:L domain-like protein [Coccomyxa subellipsoidea C-169]EIE22021.1 L domain-like protein [Coccomyxa subellipsoidea C-169]|eukprot:XP_005646565.1 L domain-like protein [Coccomyxa subellipsoidea C-169]